MNVQTLSQDAASTQSARTTLCLVIFGCLVKALGVTSYFW